MPTTPIIRGRGPSPKGPLGKHRRQKRSFLPSAPTYPAIANLVDNFATQDTSKWTFASPASVVGSRLSLPYTTSFSSQIASKAVYDFTNGYVSAQFVSLGSGEPTDANTALMVSDAQSGGALTGTYFIGLQVDANNTIEGWYDTGAGTFPSLFTGTTFDPTQHVFFRIRFSGATVYLEVAPADGVTWTTLYSGANPMAQITHLYVGFQSACTTTPTGSPAALWDNVNYAAPLAETLVDDFTTKDTVKWNWFGTASVVSGQLNLVPNASSSNRIQSAVPYNLAKSHIVARLAQPPNAGSGGNLTALVATASNANENYSVAILWNANQLTFRQTVNGVNSDTVMTGVTSGIWVKISAFAVTTNEPTYDNALWFDTSTDGIHWTGMHADYGRVIQPPGVDLTSMWINFDSFSSEATPGTAIWDNFNVLPTLPKMNTLTEDFSAQDTTNLYWLGAPTAPFVSGGQLTETVCDGSDLVTKSFYDLTDSSIAAQLVSIPADWGDNWNTGLDIRVDGSYMHHHLLIGVQSPEGLYCNYALDGQNNDTSVTYDPVAHQYLRVRHASGTGFGTFYWEASPDGIAWTVIRSADANFSPSAVIAQLSTFSYGAPFGGTAIWDNLNITGYSDGTSTTATAGLTANGFAGRSDGASATITAGRTVNGVLATTAGVSLGVTSGLTTNGSVGRADTANTAATAGLSANGALAFSRGASLVVTAASTANGVRAASDGASLLGTAGLTANGVRATSDGTSTSASTSLTAGGFIGRSDGASASISAGLTANGVRSILAGASTAVTATLSANGVLTFSDSANMTATAGLSANGLRAAMGGAAASTAASLTSDGSVGHSAGATIVTAAGLTADGSVSGGLTDGAGIAVTASLTASGFLSITDGANSVFTAGPTANGLRAATDGTSIAVAAGLTADGVRAIFNGANTAIAATLTLDGIRAILDGATAVTTASLTANGLRAVADGANTAIAAGLTTNGFRSSPAGADLIVTAGLTANGALAIHGSAPTIVAAVLTTDGTISGAATDGADIVIAAGLTVSGIRAAFSGVSIPVIANLTVDGLRTAQGDATLTAIAGLSADGLTNHMSGANRVVLASLTTDGFIAAIGASDFTASVVLTANGRVALAFIDIPPENIMTVPAISRIALVNAPSHSMSVAPTNRIVTVRPESRTEP